MIYVIAGNYEEYRAFLVANSLSPLYAICVGRASDLYMEPNNEVCFCGTWYELPDAIEFLGAVKSLEQTGDIRVRTFGGTPMRVEILRTEFKTLRNIDARGLALLRNLGWAILSIDDRAVEAFCEGCGSPILEGQKFYGPNAEDGVYLCEACGEESGADGQVQGESKDQG